MCGGDQDCIFIIFLWFRLSKRKRHENLWVLSQLCCCVNFYFGGASRIHRWATFADTGETSTRWCSSFCSVVGSSEFLGRSQVFFSIQFKSLNFVLRKLRQLCSLLLGLSNFVWFWLPVQQYLLPVLVVSACYSNSFVLSRFGRGVIYD